MKSQEQIIASVIPAYIVGILLVSVVLQTYGLGYGLPYLYGVDEIQVVDAAMRMGLGDFSPAYVVWPGAVQQNILFLLYGLYFVLGKLTGMFPSAQEFGLLYLLHPTSFYLIARLVSVACGTMAVYLVYLVGKKLYGDRVGILAGLFLACMPVFVQTAHYAITDAFMATLALLSFWAICRQWSGDRAHNYLAAGFLAGLAVAQKYNAALLVVPIFVVHSLQCLRNGVVWWKVLWKPHLGAAYLAMVIGFVVGFPYAVTHIAEVWNGLITVSTRLTALKWVGGQQMTMNPWLFLVVGILPEGMTLILEIVSLLGIGYAMWRHKEQDILVLSFLLIYLAVSGFSRVMYPRYLMPVYPFLVLLAARLVVVGMDRALFNSNRKGLIIASISLLIVAAPLWDTVRYDYLISQKDTRTIAKEWIEQTIAPGTAIAIEDGDYSPPLVPSKENLQRQLKNLKAEGKGRAVQLLAEAPAERYPKITYDLVSIWRPEEGYLLREKWTRTAEDVLHDLQHARVKYVIVNSYSYARYFSDETLRNLYSETEQRRRFYQLLEQEYTLVREFRPDPISRPGPTIKVYHLSEVER